MPANQTRSILHVDMDAFFASVEQRDRPELAGRPVLVGGSGPRSVVAAASYEARAFGCHSAQPLAVALRKCPQAVVVAPRGAAYADASERVFALCHEVTPQVEPLSIDEAFLDVTGSERLLGPPRRIAEHLRIRIVAVTGLTASVGVAPNKFLAKLGSDLHKPDGLTEIGAHNLDEVLLPLSVRCLPGIGPVAEARLDALGLRTVGDLRAFGAIRLAERLGPQGEHLFALAHGLDERPVISDARARSIGQECTFAQDLEDPDPVRAVLLEHVESVARRVRREALTCQTVTVKIRFGAFETITRSKTLDEPTDRTAQILAAAQTLFDRWARSGYRAVRLIGVTAARLAPVDSGQLQLFTDPVVERQGRLDQAMDAIQARFGSRVIGRAAGALGDPSRRDGIQRDDGT